MVVIWLKLSFCARVRFVSSADPGLAMQSARLSWWVLLSVYQAHSGYDEDDYFATLEAVRDIMGEGKKLGAVDFHRW